MAQFQDLPYLNKSRVSFSPKLGENGNMAPSGFQVGLGVEVVGTRRINTQGSSLETGKDLDIAIEGKGYFVLLNDGGEIRYPRDGAFTRNADGEIVSSHGYLLSPEMTLPDNATKITITRTGEIQAFADKNIDPIAIGQIELAIFPSESGLTAIGANVFKESNISGEPIILNPAESNAGEIFQGFLESSNADPIP